MSSPEAPSDQVLPPHRTPARTRRRRQALTFLVLISAMILAGALALGNWIGWWSIGPQAQATTNLCPVQTFTLPKLTRVNVYNGTDRHGLAGAVAKEMQARKFQVSKIATSAQAKPLNAIAVIKYGEFGDAAARTVAQQFPGKVSMVRDGRNTRTVDVLLGDKYKSLVARAKAAKAIALKPQPDGCVQPDSTPSASPSSSISSKA